MTVGDLYEMVEELDSYAGSNFVTDWELNFIADMFGIKLQGRSYSARQSEIIVDLHEKYCD